MKTVLIGFETARQLAQLGYFVYLGCRDEAKGLAAINKLRDLGISNVEMIEIDIENIDSVITKDPETKANKVIHSYNVVSIPTKFVIDEKGKIRFRLTGFECSKEGAVDEIFMMIDMVRANSLH